MNTNKFAAFTAGVIVMIFLATVVLVPTIDNARMETTSVANEGAGWAKYAYYEDAEDYSVALSSDGTTLTMGTQSGNADVMIVWSSDKAAIIHDSGDFTLLYQDGDTTSAVGLGASATIVSTSGTVTITDNADAVSYTSDSLAWSYTPSTSGQFGFFTTTGAIVNDFPMAAAGVFAGAYCYNDLTSVSSLTMTAAVTDGVFEDATWNNEE